MATFQISLRLRPRSHRETAEDAIATSLAALSKHGQIVGDFPTAEVRGGYRIDVDAPRADALDRRYGSQWVRRAEKQLNEAGFRTPQFRRLGHEPASDRSCACRR